jgi:hypothetical protein
MLAAWRERAVALGELERSLADARLAQRAGRKALVCARRQLGDRAGFIQSVTPAGAPSIDDDAELFAFLRESQSLAGEADLVRRRLDWIDALRFSDEEERRLATLRRAAEPLRAWLRAPEASAGDASTGGRWPAFAVAAGVLLALGVVLRLTASTLPFQPVDLIGLAGLAIGSGLGLGGAAWLLREDARRTPIPFDGRGAAQARFPTGVEGPARWTADDVVRRLEELEDEISKLAAAQIRSRDRDVERKTLEQDLSRVEARVEALGERRRGLRERLGLPALREDAELVDFAQALAAARRAERDSAGQDASVEALEARHGEALAGLARLLSPLGSARPEDAAAARAAIEALETRSRSLAEALAEARRQREAGDRLAREIEALEREQAKLFERAGVAQGDRPELARRVEALSRFHALTAQRARLSALIEHARGELEAADESELARREAASLEAERESLRRIAEERDDRVREIDRIRNDAARARSGHAVEEAIARRDAALDALAERREAALLAGAGVTLIEAVRAEYERDQMPRVLERTRRLFSVFTHGGYELEIAGDDAFVAIDVRSGEGKRPDALSDGTRAQLILAARLAFAEEAERGVALPIFLDEAIDHSDPARFHAIARSLARMVRDEGRQIFYLTNDPADVVRFRAAFADEAVDGPAVVDLAQVRGRAVRVEGPAMLEVPPLESVPPPGDADAAQYGLVLGVPRLDPMRAASAQHVYYLLRDDLDALHALLEARVERVGQCRSQLRGGADFLRSLAERSPAAATLGARIELLDTFCEAWREGRGRPVGRAELDRSGAVTERFLDPLAEVVGELEGDARRLLDALDERSDPRLQGFRQRSVERLEHFLKEEGYLDERPILEEADLVGRAIATPAAHRLGTKSAAELVHLWHSLSDHSKSPI